MKRALRWLKRIVLGTLALAIVAVIAVLIVLHTDWGRNLVREQIEATLLENFPGGARVGKLEGSVFGTLVVTDIVVFDMDHGPLVKVGSVKLELELLPLLTKTAHIDRLLIEDVVVTKRTQTIPTPPPPPPGSMNIEIPKLEVRGISAVIETPQGPLTLDNGSATASVNILPGGYVTANANVAATWRERNAPITVAIGAQVGDLITIPFARIAVGGVEVIATSVNVDAMSGSVTVHATPEAIAKLVPGIELPGNVNLRVVTAAHKVEGLHLQLAGTVGATSIDAVGLVDVMTGSARGVISARGSDLGRITNGHIHGTGTVVVAATTDGVHMSGTVIANGAVRLEEGDMTLEVNRGAPAIGTTGEPGRVIRGHAIVAVDGTKDGGSVLVIAAGAGQSRLAVLGGVRREGDDVFIERTLVGASTLDPSAASGGLAPVKGELHIDGFVEGPRAKLVVGGTVRGGRIVFEDKRIGTLSSRLALTISEGPGRREVRGTVHADIGGVVNAGSPIGSFTVDAKARNDGKIEVSGQARLAMAPVVVDASAIITLGNVIEVVLGPHRVRTEKGELSGDGGTVAIGPHDIVVRGVKTAPVGRGNGQITVDATVGRLTKNLVANVVAREIPASLIDPAYRGTANADVAITRVGMKWSGGGNVVVKKFSIGPDTLPIDAEGKLTVDGRRVTLEGHVASPTVGGARLALVVDGPVDLTDAAAWMRVRRSDLHAVTIGVERLDLAALTDRRVAGTADGTLVIHAGVPSGSLAIRDVPTPAGMVDADVTLSLTDAGFVDAMAKAKVGTLGGADAEIRLQIPDRIFDPIAWKALGPGVVHRATIRTTDVAFDGRLLARFGIDAPYSGRANAEILVGTGGSSVDVKARVRGIHGGMIKRDLDVALIARADDKGTDATVRVGSGTRLLLDLPDAHSPVRLADWIADPKAQLASRVSGTMTIPRIPAREVLGIFGRMDVLEGTVEGKVVIAGTITVPTVVATVDLLAVRVKPRLVSRPLPMLTALHLEASWDGSGGKVHLTASEENKGTLVVDASGRPDQLASVKLRMKVANFDIAPLAVFLPGPLVGASGKLEADLVVNRLDPSLGSITGFLHLINGRVPIAPTVGTLRAADIRIDLDDGGVTAKLDGKIGGGTIKLEATTTDLVNARVFGEVTKFSPIIALAPVINGRVTGTFSREGRTWVGDLRVSRASIAVPEQSGNALLDAAAPEDLIFVDRPIPLPKRAARAPQRPLIIAAVSIEPTRITMPELQVVGSISGQVQVSVGDTLGLDGQVGVDTATLVIAGHRYRVEIGQVAFDGTTDALIDFKLAHDFPDVTTYVQASTRLSQIDRVEPQFTSEPGIYTQGQLLGFFLGGAPGGDPSKQTAEAAAGFGASVASTFAGKWLKKVPLVSRVLSRVQIGCKPGAGQSSSSCTAGTWATKKTYVTFEGRIDSRPDENAGQGKVEYYWKPNRTVELTGGDRGFFGLDLLWRHRW
ncbi:MAG: translocation/assembly module TamB domain-containing protein [Deltaproteobacteria bacterium]|nr:translocation/assembly module TamB domain-containing protein [Deltaproteobacteria bacterium]